ncbi:MAG: hypothetical protein ACR2OA_05260 [Rubripirellula sp.]
MPFLSRSQSVKQKGWTLLVCLLVLGAMREARCEESQHSHPERLEHFDERRLSRSFADGIDFLITSQRADGGWGGPQWTGGVDSDPVPGSFRSFDVAVTAMCLEALLADNTGRASVEKCRHRALRFLLDRTGNIKRAGPSDLPNVWAHCYCIQTFSRLFQISTSEAEKNTLVSAIRKHMKGLDRWQSIHGGWF